MTAHRCYHRRGPSRTGSGPFAVRFASGPRRRRPGGDREDRRRPREPRVAVRRRRATTSAGWSLDRLADRAGWAGRGRTARRRRASSMGRYHGPRPDARQAADLHERLRARRPQGARPRARAARATCSSSPTTSRCRSASSASARAAAPAATTACARSSTSSGTEKFSRLRVGIGEPGPRRRATTSCRRSRPTSAQRLDELLDAAADAVEAWARDGTSKAANRFNMFELRPADADAARARRARSTARPTPDGIRRTRTGWRRVRLPAEDAGVSRPPLRGRRGATGGSPSASRRLRRATRRPARTRRRLRRRGGRRRGRRRAATPAPARRRRPAPPADARRRPPPARPLALPPLLAATGRSIAPRAPRLAPRRSARRAAATSGSPPSRTARRRYLAAALALGDGGERLVWIARDAEIGDRVAEELGAWLGDAGGRRRARAADGARLRAQRARRRRDGRPRRGAAAWRSGRARILVASVQALAPAHDRPGRPAGRRRASSRSAARLAPGRAAARAVRPRLRAGRSRSPAAASSPGAAGSSTSSRRRCRCRSGSSSSATRSTRSGRSTRPTSGRSARSTSAVLLPASEFLLPHGGVAALRERLGRRRREAPRAPRRGPRPVRGRDDPRERRAAAPASRGARRRRRGRGLGAAPRPGDRPRPRRPRHAPRPRRARRHRRGRRVPVAPGRRAPGRARSRPASCRRTGRRPTSAPRDWKARLVALADARADLGVGAARGRGDGRAAA